MFTLYVVPKINERLQIWKGAWAHHRMRTTKTTPWKLWLSGQINSPIGMYISVEDLSHYGVEGDIPDDHDNNNNPAGDLRPIFTEAEVIPQNVVEIIHNIVPPNLFNETTGIDLYIEALTLATPGFFGLVIPRGATLAPTG